MPLIKIQKDKPNLGIIALRNLANIGNYFPLLLKRLTFPHRQRIVVLVLLTKQRLQAHIATVQVPSASKIVYEEKTDFINHRAINTSCLPRSKQCVEK